MKAVILADGGGGLLRPISMGRATAMTSLLGRPIMEHLLHLLRRHNITQICVVAQQGGQAIMDRFGDGGRLGVQLTYRTENMPSDTVERIKACSEFAGGENVLIVPGNSVCDFDLTAAVNFHRERDALATMLVCRHPKPLKCGMVLCDDRGRVERLLEKHSSDRVVTNMANTGLCILSPGVWSRISAGKGQTAENSLISILQACGEALYACSPEGYWRGVEDCESYLECVCDALSGKVKLDMGLEQRQPGVWSADPIPDQIHVIPPCWIGPEVCIGKGSLVGPHVVLERGSQIGTRSMVQRSVLMEATVADRATVYGATLCSGSQVGNEAVLNEGVVLGEHARVGDRALLMERVRIWPGRTVREGARQTHSISAGGASGALRFGDGGIIRGILGEDLVPESVLALGRALGREGKVAIGCFGGPGAQMLLRSAASGITAAGGTALYHEMECAAQAAWVAESYQMPRSLFIEQEGEKVYLHLFDGCGLRLGPGQERKLEQALRQGECGVGSMQVGGCEHLPIGPGDYAADGARRARLRRTSLRGVRVAVPGKSPADRAIRLMLEKMGCQVVDQWRRGIPAFSGSYGGFRLSARDESGALLSPRQLLAVVALVELENGGGRLAVPDDAGAALELMAAGFDRQVLRLERDGEQARQLYRALPWLRDAAFGAARLCARMALNAERLEQLYAKTPRFSGWTREVPLVRDRDEIMRELTVHVGRGTLNGTGLHLRSRGGWVYLVPLSRRPAIKVVAEGPDLELAAELCDFYAAQVSELDGQTPGQQTK